MKEANDRPTFLVGHGINGRSALPIGYFLVQLQQLADHLLERPISLVTASTPPRADLAFDVHSRAFGGVLQPDNRANMFLEERLGGTIFHGAPWVVRDGIGAELPQKKSMQVLVRPTLEIEALARGIGVKKLEDTLACRLESLGRVPGRGVGVVGASVSCG